MIVILMLCHIIYKIGVMKPYRPYSMTNRPTLDTIHNPHVCNFLS